MTRSRNQKEIDENFLFDALEAGVARKEVAKMLGISTPTLSARIGDLQKKQGLLLQYRSIQALQLTEIQARVLEAITPDKIEEASLKDLVLCYKVLKDKELVVDGKPSEIKGLVSYLVHLEREQIAAAQPIEVSKEDYNDMNVNFNEDIEEKLPNL